VREWKGGVVFLHEVAAGAAGRSWGVHVAELAGVPAPVVRRAAALLAGLEREGRRSLAPAELPLFAAAPPASEPAVDPLHAAVAALDLDRMTPREAMDRLYQLKALLPVTGEANTVPSA
jgi:DNA mismatch repair protein MutS